MILHHRDRFIIDDVPMLDGIHTLLNAKLDILWSHGVGADHERKSPPRWRRHTARGRRPETPPETPEKANAHPLHEAIDNFLLTKRVAGCTAATLATYRWWLERFAAATRGVSPLTVRAFFAGLQHRSASHQHQAYRILTYGLDLAFPAIFLGLVLPALRTRREWVTAGLAAALALGGRMLLPEGIALLPRACWPPSCPSRPAVERRAT